MTLPNNQKEKEEISKEVQQLAELLLAKLHSFGFHIGDGVDDCAGTDQEKEMEAAKRIIISMAINSTNL